MKDAPPTNSPLIVAIDGPAGAGKSTVARGVAERLGIPYVDSGAMYRSIALLALRGGIDLDDAGGLSRLAEETEIEWKDEPGRQRIYVHGESLEEKIRTPEVSQAASKVSAAPGVRAALLDQQRRLGRIRGCVMEGRDIGTIVFPEAQLKIFLTASSEERIRRRTAELQAKGSDTTQEEVRAQMEERDRRDAERDLAPMKPAFDAAILSTDGLSPGEVVDRIVALCDRSRES